MQIAQPSTPANFFHLLRRQVVRPWRKPLVVFTPKSLLRHPRAVSPLEDLASKTFKRVIGDADADPSKTARIFLCTGRIYYDLLQKREQLEQDDVAIVRLEQLYPLPDRFLEAALSPYADGTPVIWVQDEPENMGAWRHLKNRFGLHVLGRFPFSGIYREESASPATGSAASHKLEQQRLLAAAFAV